MSGFDPFKPIPPSPSIFSDNRPDGSNVCGTKGGTTHAHEYDSGMGIGHIKVNGEKTKFPFNNLNEKIDDVLPEWMKKK